MGSVPTHRLFVYQKPRLGTGFIDQYRVANYKHKLNYQGGYESASCTLMVGQTEAERVFRDFIGNAVTIHVDDPINPIFDGYINAIVYEEGNLVFRRSLDEMSNRVRVTFYNADSPAAMKTEMTAVVDNTGSQAIYGVKESNIDAGVHYNNADKTHKTKLRDTILSVLSWPQVSVTSRAGGATLLTLEIKGWTAMLDWTSYVSSANLTYSAFDSVYDKTVGANRSANADFIFAVTPATGHFDFISANTAFNQGQNSQSGQTHRQFIQSTVEAGDGTNEWVWGITARDWNRGNRFVYYRAASTAVNYTTRALSASGQIFDKFNRLVDPWRVMPDNGIRVTDALVGYDQAGDDPSVSYLKFISYDAESQQISWQSSDDATLEGSFQLNKYFKRHGRRFGAPVRPTV